MLNAFERQLRFHDKINSIASTEVSLYQHFSTISYYILDKLYRIIFSTKWLVSIFFSSESVIGILKCGEFLEAALLNYKDPVA